MTMTTMKRMPSTNLVKAPYVPRELPVLMEAATAYATTVHNDQRRALHTVIAKLRSAEKAKATG